MVSRGFPPTSTDSVGPHGLGYPRAFFLNTDYVGTLLHTVFDGADARLRRGGDVRPRRPDVMLHELDVAV